LVAKFPYEKAVLAIAEADLYGNAGVLEKYGITSMTLWRWRQRANADPKMLQDVRRKKKFLLNDWQADASKTLKTGLSEMTRRFQTGKDKDDALMIQAIAAATKVVGELKMDALLVLTDGDSEGDSEQETEGNREEFTTED
jgi:hypothetical protein